MVQVIRHGKDRFGIGAPCCVESARESVGLPAPPTAGAAQMGQDPWAQRLNINSTQDWVNG